MNRQTIVGNLGQDATLRYTQTGRAVANLRVATNERFVDQAGEQRERTTWHNLVVWGGRAEKAGRLRKGQRIMADGRMEMRSWKDKEGQTRYTPELVVGEVAIVLTATSRQNQSPEDEAPQDSSSDSDDFVS